MTSLAPVLDGRVLIAEDDHDMRALLRDQFLSAGIEVDLVADGAQLRERLFNGHNGIPQIVVSDVKMPGASGLEVLKQLRTYDANVRVILITAFGDARTHRRAEQLGAEAVLDKPFDVSELLAVVNRLLGNVASD